MLWTIDIEAPLAARVQTMVSDRARRVVGGARSREGAEARAALVALLRAVMVIHRKDVLDLPKPIFTDSEVVVPYWPRIETVGSTQFQGKVDRAQALHITKQIAAALSVERASGAGSSSPQWGERPVKAVVYSSDRGNLLSVAEAMYGCSAAGESGFETFDDKRCAEFTGGDFGGVAGGGGYNSSELQRFRTNTRRCVCARSQSEHLCCPWQCFVRTPLLSQSERIAAAAALAVLCRK